MATSGPISSLPLGTHTVTASFSSDNEIAPSEGTLGSDFAVRAPTSVAATTTSLAATFGRPVTLSAVVSDEVVDGDTPDGQVDFTDATTGADLGTAPVIGGTATLVLPGGLGVGTHAVAVAYLGDLKFFPSAALENIAVSVAPATTTTAVTASLATSVTGQPLSFTATVTSAGGTPAGSVAFYDQATDTDLGTFPLVGGVAATPPIATFGAGFHQVTATYLGSGDFAVSLGTVDPVVGRDGVAAAGATSPVAPTFGVPVTLSVTVSAAAPGSGVPTGVVDFNDLTTGAAFGTAPLVNGVATMAPISTLGVGAHTILVLYEGDPNFTLLVTTFTLTVAPAATTVAVAASATPSPYGQPVVFRATVAAVAPGGGTPTGTVQFAVDGVDLGAPVPVVAGVAVSPAAGASALGLGAHSITASFVGDPGFSASVGALPVGLPVRAATTTTIAASSGAVAAGQRVTFTATVTTASPGLGTPGGIVTFLDTANGLTTLGVAVLVNGVAVFSPAAPLGLGKHTVVAVYGGDASDLGSHSSNVGATSTVTTAAGDGSLDPLGDGGPAASAAIGSPGGVAVDPAGDVFLADTANNRVREVTPDGLITTIAADLSAPDGLAVDAVGDLFIADTGNNRVVEVYVDPASERVGPASVVAVVAGTGAAGNSGDGGPATAATLNAPRGVAVDARGDLFIADGGNGAVREVTPNGVIGTLATGLGTPTAVATDAAGDVYVADAAGGTLRKVTPAGLATTVLAGLAAPGGLAVDALGNIFVADTGHDRIMKINTAGVVTTFAGNGSASFGGDGGPATAAGLSAPAGLAVDSFGTLFLADAGNNRVRAVSPSGTIRTLAGAGSATYAGDGGPAASASLATPSGVAVDAAGDLFIADTADNVVREVSPAGVITTVAGTGAAGYSGDGGLATTAMLDGPSAVAVDAAGDLFIADAGNNRVREVSPTGLITTVAGSGAFGTAGDGGQATAASISGPAGIAVDAAGDLFLTDSFHGLVREVNAAGVITTVAGTLTPGPLGDGGPATAASLSQPTGVAVDAAGDLFIADAGNNRVREVSPAGLITTVAGDGASGFGGDGGPASAASVMLSMPTGVAVDAAGDLFIADAFNRRVRGIGPAGSITTVAGVGSPLFFGDGGPASGAAFDIPSGLATDAAGDLFIADPSGNRVRRVANGVSVVVSAASSLTLTAPSSTTATGGSLTFTAVASTPVAGVGTPQGQVTFSDTFGGTTTNYAGVPLASGVASEALTLTGAGTHVVTATFNDPAGRFAPSSASFSVTVLAPFTIASIVPVSPAVRNTAPTSITVTFSRPIDPLRLTASALSLSFDQGAPTPLTDALTVTPAGGSTYILSDPHGFGASDGHFILTVDASKIKDPFGAPGSGTDAALWLLDRTPPASHVVPFTQTSTSNPSLALTIRGTDPGVDASGLARFAVYVSVDGGAFSLWATAPAASGAATFAYAGQPGHRYGFFSLATDAAGNAEFKAAVPEASVSINGTATGGGLATPSFASSGLNLAADRTDPGPSGNGSHLVVQQGAAVSSVRQKDTTPAPVLSNPIANNRAGLIRDPLSGVIATGGPTISLAGGPQAVDDAIEFGRKAAGLMEYPAVSRARTGIGTPCPPPTAITRLPSPSTAPQRSPPTSSPSASSVTSTATGSSTGTT